VKPNRVKNGVDTINDDKTTTKKMGDKYVWKVSIPYDDKKKKKKEKEA